MVAIEIRCPKCRKMNKPIMADERVLSQIARYKKGLGFIQDIDLSVDEREVIQTGLCPACWDSLWDDEEGDEEA